MQICKPHWDLLREEIVAHGMGEWIAPDGETAAEQLADLKNRNGESTAVNYDPLMDCYLMIIRRSVDVGGIDVMTADFGCPICVFNEKMRNADGSCRCGRQECSFRKPGIIPPFESWINGPNSCVVAARNFMLEQGWISEGGD